MATENPICPTCTCQIVEGGIKIHDERKHLTSPLPCPECEELWLASAAEAGDKAAQAKQNLIEKILHHNFDCKGFAIQTFGKGSCPHCGIEFSSIPDIQIDVAERWEERFTDMLQKKTLNEFSQYKPEILPKESNDEQE